MSGQGGSSDVALAELIRGRNQLVREVRDDFVERPRCAIIPSPDKLDRSLTERGQDEIATRKDFRTVWEWLTTSEVLNTEFYAAKVKETVKETDQLESKSFKTLVQLAFGPAFDAIRNTHHPEREEMVLLYYSGHGLPINPTLDGSSFPAFNKLDFVDAKLRELKEPAENLLKFLNPYRKLKGGELCLHDVGFCDLQGLLAPFVAAVTKESSNARGKKKNKHLVVIADSCHSGVLAQDLQQLIQRDGPWKENGCSVTLQSACSKDEVTYGGYFTDCFVHFNKPENQRSLEELKQDWNKKNETEKNEFRHSKLPSPCVETTMSPEQPNDEDPIMKISIQNVPVNLFRDPGFFKFCYLSFSGVIAREVSPENKPRVLSETDADGFLGQTKFDIMDYKLMKMKMDGTPMALFLVEYRPKKRDRVVCAHIHFKSADTDVCNVSTVTLVQHKRPRNPSDLFLIMKREKRGNISENIENLVAMCKSYVDEKEDGRWEDVGRWDMKSGDLGVNNKFKLKERSDWMDNYLKEIVRENTA